MAWAARANSGLGARGVARTEFQKVRAACWVMLVRSCGGGGKGIHAAGSLLFFGESECLCWARYF